MALMFSGRVILPVSREAQEYKEEGADVKCFGVENLVGSRKKLALGRSEHLKSDFSRSRYFLKRDSKKICVFRCCNNSSDFSAG